MLHQKTGTYNLYLKSTTGWSFRTELCEFEKSGFLNRNFVPYFKMTFGRPMPQYDTIPKSREYGLGEGYYHCCDFIILQSQPFFFGFYRTQ